jgi:hypothetical protein
MTEREKTLHIAYMAAISGKDVSIPAEDYVYLYRMGGFHLPVPRVWRKLRERFT